MKTILKIACSFMLLVSLGACASPGTDPEPGTTKTTTSAVTNNGNDIADLNGMMEYLKGKGLMFNQENDLTELDEGYLEGRSFNSNDVMYGMYRYDRNHTGMSTSVEEARTTKKLRMKVNGEYVDVPVIIYGDYILAYPEGTDVSSIEAMLR